MERLCQRLVLLVRLAAGCMRLFVANLQVVGLIVYWH